MSLLDENGEDYPKTSKADDELFDQWKALFTKYRSYGALADKERKKFKELSKEVAKKGWLKNLSSDIKKGIVHES